MENRGNPLEDWLNKKSLETRLILLSDDTDDRPYKWQRSLNKEHYYNWHTLAIPFSAISSVEKIWLKIKEDHNIPDLFLHSNRDSNLLKHPTSTIRQEIHDLLSSFGIRHYFCSVNKRSLKRKTKEQALIHYLESLDEQLEKDFYNPSGKAFCDKTDTSTKTSAKLISCQAVWDPREYSSFNNIKKTIFFRVQKDPSDIITRCLDLPDYCAWITSRTFRLTRGRYLVSSGRNWTSHYWKYRMRNLHIGDREQCNLFLERLNNGLIKYLKI